MLCAFHSRDLHSASPTKVCGEDLRKLFQFEVRLDENVSCLDCEKSNITKYNQTITGL